MAKKTTTNSKPEAAAKRAIKSAEKPKAVATPPPKAVPAPPPKAVPAPPPKTIPASAPVESKPPKTEVTNPPKTAVKAKKAVKKAAPAPLAFTQEDVALRAYFISEKRRSNGLPGDEHQDWLEAERQIVTEFAKKKTAKKP